MNTFPKTVFFVFTLHCLYIVFVHYRYFTKQYPPPLTSTVSPALCLVRSDIENLLSTTSSALVSQWNLTNQVSTWFLYVWGILEPYQPGLYMVPMCGAY